MEWIFAGLVLAILLFFASAVIAGYRDWRRERRYGLHHPKAKPEPPLSVADQYVVVWLGITERRWRMMTIAERADARDRFFKGHDL